MLDHNIILKKNFKARKTFFKLIPTCGPEVRLLPVWLSHFLFAHWTHSLSSDSWSSMWTCWLPLLLIWLRLFQVFGPFSWCRFPVRGLKHSKDLRPKIAIPVQNQSPLQFFFYFISKAEWTVLRISQTGVANAKKGRQSIIWSNSAENCLKMKKIGLHPKFYCVD